MRTLLARINLIIAVLSGSAMLSPIMLMGQARSTLRPTHILKTQDGYLGPGCKVSVTASPFVITAEGASGADEEIQRIEWNGNTGEVLRSTLPPLEPEDYFNYGCGGTGGSISFRTWPPRWEAADAIVDADWDHQSLHLHFKDGGTRSIPPLNPMPGLAALGPLQRLVMGGVGFRDVFWPRSGQWVAAIWSDVSLDPAGRPRAPGTHEQRWLVYTQDSDRPKVDLPLDQVLTSPKGGGWYSTLGDGHTLVAQENGNAFLVDVLTGHRLFDAKGRWLLPVPLREIVLMRIESGPYLANDDSFVLVEVATGKVVGAFSLPDQLPWDSPGPEGGTQSTPYVSSPLAFSEDGRWLVTGRGGPRGAHYDALLLWDLEPAWK